MIQHEAFPAKFIKLTACRVINVFFHSLTNIYYNHCVSVSIPGTELLPKSASVATLFVQNIAMKFR